MKIYPSFKSEGLEEDLDDLPVILFPHCHVADPDLEKIISLFGGITICQPWFMDDPPMSQATPDFSRVHLVRPSERLKPQVDFDRLLSEYRLWMKNNQDKGRVVFLRAIEGIPDSEDTPWEIRQMIRHAGKGITDSKENRALRWHIILHLAREFEEYSLEAEEMLNRVKQQGSPLYEAVEEDISLQGFFQDMPRSEIDASFDKHHMMQIFEAWVGLFGDYLQEHSLLITLNPYVIDYATTLFEDVNVSTPGEPDDLFDPELTSIQDRITLRYLPRPLKEESVRTDPVLKSLSGKTLILLNE
jgi:hypothetical protein